MRTKSTIVWLVCSAAPAAGQLDPLWIAQFGSNRKDFVCALEPDRSGGMFVAGYTEGSYAAPIQGYEDVFVARHDGMTGEPLWIVQFGTQGGERAHAMAADSAGGVFVGGVTSGDLAGENPNPGWWDAFLARYDEAGEQLWAIQFGGDGHDLIHALAPDGAGGVFVAGQTQENWQSNRNAFVARYSESGSRHWMVTFGSENNPDSALALAPDGADGLFVAGETSGKIVDWHGGHDIFLARYDGSGTLIWVVQLGTEKNDQAWAVAQDGEGGAVVGGFTAGDLARPVAGSADLWLARYDAEGTQLWLRQDGVEGSDGIGALEMSDDGRVFAGGWTEGSLFAEVVGYIDAMVAIYDLEGALLGGMQLASSGREHMRGLARTGDGGVFFAGDTDNDAGGPNLGEADFFLGRLGSVCPPDCDGSGALDLFDFLCFFNLFNAADPAADCDTSESLDLFDFLCFVNAFNEGC
jgi:hypothetical protein